MRLQNALHQRQNKTTRDRLLLKSIYTFSSASSIRVEVFGDDSCCRCDVVMTSWNLFTDGTHVSSDQLIPFPFIFGNCKHKPHSQPNQMMQRLVIILIPLVLLGTVSHAYVPSRMPTPTHRRSLWTVRNARAGKGKLKKNLGSTTTSPQNTIPWIPLETPVSALPTVTNKIQLLDTNLPTLTNAATNPTGAVAVAQVESNNYYCFSSSCPSCKIPLTKATIMDGTTIRCNFCQSSYKLKNGRKLENKPAGIFGGMVQKVFAAQDSGPLPIYRLGEKDGKLLIAFE